MNEFCSSTSRKLNKIEKKYVVKDFEAQTYYAFEDGGMLNWEKESYLADYFDTVEDAERCIDRENGKFQIETVCAAF